MNAEQNEKKITRVEEIIKSQELDTTCVLSLTITKDNRIASGGANGNISISSYNINKCSWNIDIYKKKAHEYRVGYLCSLNDNRLLSCGVENSIKVWSISDEDITLLKEIKEQHTDTVWKMIPLSNERFASCSGDCTVKIWESDTYQLLSTLTHDESVRSIIQLKYKEVLVSCTYHIEHNEKSRPRYNEGLNCIYFWDLNNNTKQYTIERICVNSPNHMIELSDGNIALSTNKKKTHCPIIIIDKSSYQKQEIESKEYITNGSSLCAYANHSFIYACKGTLLQISNDGSILFQSKGGKDSFIGSFGVIPIEDGNYFVIDNGNCISIIKLCYD